MTAAPDPGWRPPYPYVPGATPRHPEGLFDALKDVAPGDAPERLAASTAWAAGRAFLREGFFWESHEVLEALWLACPPNGAERLAVRGVIQLANAGLKARMGRPAAAARLEALARAALDEAARRGGLAGLGLDSREVEALVAAACGPRDAI